jgi:hypothetical protein
MPLLVAWKCLENLHTAEYLWRLHPHRLLISTWHFIESPAGHSLLLMTILTCLVLVKTGRSQT